MKIFPVLCVLAFLLTFSPNILANSISVAQVGGFLHGNGSLLAQFDDTSASYFSTLNSQ